MNLQDIKLALEDSYNVSGVKKILYNLIEIIEKQNDTIYQLNHDIKQIKEYAYYERLE